MNIVFDLGGVVFDWNPEKIARSVLQDAEASALVKEGIFGHADWVALDKGTITQEDAVVRGASRTGLSETTIENLLNEVPRSLTPFQDTIVLIRSLASSNNRLFVLSNMHLASIKYLEEHHDIWGMFEGAVISSRIKMVKPDAEIYEHLLREHRLDASETVFIDDMAENVAAASSVGINPIQFRGVAQCRQELKNLGCI